MVHVEIRQLTTFLTVASTLSFTRAADSLNYAQSSVTAQIQALEEELGVPLFERLGRRVELSTAGLRLQPYAEKIVRLCEEARVAVPDDHLPGGTLTIGAPESLCAYRLPPVLFQFKHLFPRVRLVFWPGIYLKLVQMLNEGKLDIGILLERPANAENLIFETLTHEPLAVITYPSHPLAQRSIVEPRDLEGETLLLVESGYSYTALFQQTLAAASVNNDMLNFSSIEAIKQCVMAGMGIGFLPVITVEAELARGRLVRLPWSAGDYGLTTLLAWHRDKWISPALRAFIDVSHAILAPSGDAAPETRPDSAGASAKR